MQITIASIQTNAPKMGTVQTTDGSKLGFWKSELTKLALQGGGTYEVETEPWHDKTIIVKARQIAGTTEAQKSVERISNGNGHYRPTSPEDAERMFVCSLLNAFIKAGKIEPELNRVVNATNVLRTAWSKTFGGKDNCFSASEAGHYHMEAAE